MSIVRIIVSAVSHLMFLACVLVLVIVKSGTGSGSDASNETGSDVTGQDGGGGVVEAHEVNLIVVYVVMGVSYVVLVVETFICEDLHFLRNLQTAAEFQA